jgi:hypothetical protein
MFAPKVDRVQSKARPNGKLVIPRSTLAPQAFVESAADGVAAEVVRETLLSPGVPLDAQTRSRFEPRFGYDLSRVRIHADAKAAQSADILNALAYTVGPKIVFSAGCYAPHLRHGSRLLAHELAHVVQQQRGGPSSPPLHAGPLEQAADAAASSFLVGRGPIHVAGSSAPGIARQVRAGEPVVGVSKPAPPYLRDLDARLQRMVDKQVRYVAEMSGPIAEIRRKYPESPARRGAIIDIPVYPISENKSAFSDLNSPHGRFQTHSRLYGGYELLDYYPPSVLIARDGIGYVINDAMFEWMFGVEFPEVYAEFEHLPKFKHAHPFATLFGEIGMSSIPLPINPEAFMATVLMPILPGFGEIAAVGSGPHFEPEVGPFPESGEVPADPGTTSGKTSDSLQTRPPVQPLPEPAEPVAILPNGKTIPPDSYGGGYHGTDIPPDIAMKHGLPARGNDWRLLEHVYNNPNTAFRGVTTQPTDPIGGQGAAAWAGEGGYVYEIRRIPTWGVNRALEGRVKTPEGFGGNIMHGENEYVIPARVPASSIVRCGLVKMDKMGRLYVDWIVP